MLFPRRRLRFASWFALMAMMAFALVPTISHAVAHARGASVFEEICSASGLQPQPADPQRSAGFGHFEHCPFCHLQADTPVLPRATARAIAPPHLAEPPSSRCLASPAVRFAWRSAPSRAPPWIA